MSYVTNLILHMGILEEEDEQIKKVNAFFGEGTNPLIGLHEQPLPEGWYGGSKYLECLIYVGAFNFLDLDGFLKHLQTIEWTSPEDLQVFVSEQNDTKFKIIYGVEEFDKRVWDRNTLLYEAADWLSDLEKLVTDDYERSLLRKWQEQYKELSE